MTKLSGVIASGFASGLSWRGSLVGKESFERGPGLNRHEIMSAFEHFLGHNPEMAEKPYGDAMAASLSRTFPCRRPAIV
jgi:hypothetical protein